MQHLHTGNFHQDASDGSDWVMGYNNDAAIHSSEVALKWSELTRGDNKTIPFANATSTTLVIVLRGKLRIRSFDPTGETTLEKEGDYMLIPPGVMHTREILEDALIVTLRWPAIDDDQVQSS